MVVHLIFGFVNKLLAQALHTWYIPLAGSGGIECSLSFRTGWSHNIVTSSRSSAV